MNAWFLLVSLATAAEPLEDGTLLFLENCSSVVQRSTNSSVGHVAILMHEESQPWIYEAIPGGVRRLKADDYYAELSRLKALKVISRTSVMKYKNAKETLPEIAKALGVKGVVEGSVMRDGKTVRITVQLIDAASDRHLWTETYTREDRNVLVLQSEVASAIAREVRVAVSPEEAGRLVAARPVDPEAHRLVLEIVRHIFRERRDRRIALGRVLLQRLRNDVFEIPAQCTAHSLWRGGAE